MRRFLALALSALALLLVLPAGATAQTQTRTDPDETVPTDVREVAWSLSGGTVSVTQTLESAPPESFAFLDTDRDGDSDYAVSASSGNQQVAWQLYRTTASTADCQQIQSNEVLASGQVPLEQAGAFVRFTISFPASHAGGASAWRWAVAGRSPDPNGGHHVDFVPDATAVSNAQPQQPCGAGGVALTIGKGVLFPDPPGQQPPPPPPPQQQQPTPPKPPAPPVAVLSVVGPPPAAGGVITFSAAGSTADAGRKIVAHLWDLNGDGDFEANTGTRPTATFVAGDPGGARARVAVIDSSGLRGTAEANYKVNSAVTGCENKLAKGQVRLKGNCIKPAGSGTGSGARAAQAGKKYEVKGVLDYNGLWISSSGSGLVFDFEKGTVEGSGGITVKLNNTPIGDVVIYRKSGKVVWQLPVNGSVVPKAGELGYRLATIGAGDGCTAGERAYCAKLPGGFPMSGKVDLFLNSKAEIVADVNASLSSPFSITGRVVLRMVPVEGLKLDSLFFGMENAEFGIFKLEKLRFVYEGPGTGDPFHAGELWEAEVSVTLPTAPPAKVSGELRFVDGGFDYGRAELRIPGGIPVGPGIFLNRFAGEFGLTPTRIGGGFGVSLGTVAQLDANFAYQSRSGVANLHADGEFSLLGQRLATAYFDYWSTGYVGFGGQFFYQYPASSGSLLKVNGKVDAWFEDSRFQAEGDVHLAVWKINARVRAIANNTWLGACASIRIIWSVTVHAALNVNNGDLDLGFGCNMDAWRIRPLRHSGPPARAAAAQAGEATLQVGSGEEALGVELTGRGGSPFVTLIGPRGERYTTPASADGAAGEQDKWAASQFPELSRTLVYVRNPSPGVWRIVPEAGSPAIERMRTQGELPDPRVRARVSGRGARRVLRYSMTPQPGQRVRLVSRGATSLQEVCVITRASGTCPFVTDPGSPARRIEGTIEVDGVPKRTVTLARFTAPSGRPGPVRRPRITRLVPERASVVWRSARGARAYRVLITSNDGRRELRIVRRPRLVVRGLVREDTLRVRVQGLGPADIAGPARTVSAPALRAGRAGRRGSARSRPR